MVRGYHVCVERFFAEWLRCHDLLPYRSFLSKPVWVWAVAMRHGILLLLCLSFFKKDRICVSLPYYRGCKLSLACCGSYSAFRRRLPSRRKGSTLATRKELSSLTSLPQGWLQHVFFQVAVAGEFLQVLVDVFSVDVQREHRIVSAGVEGNVFQQILHHRV